MGGQKFYESRQGQVIATLLLNSGKIYSSDTVEHKLIDYHLRQMDQYTMLRDLWFSDTALDILAVSAKNVEKPAMDNYMKGSRERFQLISEIIDPYRAWKEEIEEYKKRKAAEEKAIRAKQPNLIASLNAGGPINREQLNSIVQKLHSAVEGIAKNVHTGSKSSSN